MMDERSNIVKSYTQQTLKCHLLHIPHAYDYHRPSTEWYLDIRIVYDTYIHSMTITLIFTSTSTSLDPPIKNLINNAHIDGLVSIQKIIPLHQPLNLL